MAVRMPVGVLDCTPCHSCAKIRVILNKAGSVDTQSLMRVYDVVSRQGHRDPRGAVVSLAAARVLCAVCVCV